MKEDHSIQDLVIFFLIAAVIAGGIVFTPDAAVWVGVAVYHVLHHLVLFLMSMLLVGGGLSLLTSLLGWVVNWFVDEETRLTYRTLSIWTLSSLLMLIAFFALYNYTFIGPWISQIAKLV